jgi:hypothetical protein
MQNKRSNTDKPSKSKMDLLERDLKKIDAKGHYIPWDQAKKELGL